MLLFTDVETTGLLPQKGLLLEVAIVVTDNDLAEIATHVEVIHHSLEAIVASGVDDYVRKMHTDNNLWNEVAEATASIGTAQMMLLHFVKKYTEAKTVPMAGNTISFDRNWLKEHMPQLEAHYSHRNVDFSSVTELMKRWNNPVWETRPGGKQTDIPPHRSLPDCHQSIDVAKHYMPHLMER